MPIPENPTAHTPEWARDFLVEYDAAYDELDDQGQFNPTQIHAMLAKKFFSTSVAPSMTLAKIRSLADSAKVTEVSAVAEKVADAAAKLIEPQQTTLFDFQPSETTEVLRPKSELEMNYEDFEAAWGIQSANGAKPEYVEFETVVNGVRKTVRFSYVLAKAIMIPPSKSVRTMALRHHLHKDEPDF
ncbi:MAG: hypothetical protein WA194_00795 [Patescibacteria group bacterium]